MMPRAHGRAIVEAGPLAAWRSLAVPAALSWFTLFGGAAIVLAARRLSGALERPLGAAALAVIGLLLALAVALARLLAQEAGRSRLLDWLARVAWLPGVLAAASITMRGSGPWGWLAVWLPLGIGEVLARYVSKLRWSQVSPGVETPPRSDRILQTFERRQTAHGEAIVGQLRIDLAEGQRVAQAHVAFCPPLEPTPEVEVRQTAGPGARLRLAQVLPYGARFEVKLADNGPATVELEFSATSTSALAPTRQG